jgi:hypothetical protein
MTFCSNFCQGFTLATRRVKFIRTEPVPIATPPAPDGAPRSAGD